ncbi:MAG: LysM peptidoglycan-binding domain-containing protein [Desulfobacteraceae bacterium]|nr:LysM peptidoglycan-binding domain-containing protein [Desulfobacteraceae bacterium]
MSKTKGLKNDITSNPEARLNYKKSGDDNEQDGASLLKKSELSAIFIGAGIITLIVFFVFFKSSAPESKEPAPKPADVQSIEARMEKLEMLVDLRNTQAGTNPSLESYNARVERVEAALSMKFDLVSDRLAALEKGLSGLEKKLDKSIVRSTQAKTKPPVKKVVKKPAPVKKKAPAKVATRSTVRHTVKKGDTLYNISRRYKTSVDKLKALNKLGPKAEIFPGDKLVVK